MTEQGTSEANQLNSSVGEEKLVLDEWCECRTTIGRFDTILADTRKYGFTLVTILLTANALVTAGDVVVDRVAASSVVMFLVLVLFLLDRYYYGLLRSAVTRAWKLEEATRGWTRQKSVGSLSPDEAPIQITTRLREYALKAKVSLIASGVYVLFVGVATAIAVVSVATKAQNAAPGVLVTVGVALCIIAVMLGAYLWVRRELEAVGDRLIS